MGNEDDMDRSISVPSSLPTNVYKGLSRLDLSTINGTKNVVYSLAKKRLEGKGANDKRFLKC
jgi:hypothetical protein